MGWAGLRLATGCRLLGLLLALLAADGRIGPFAGCELVLAADGRIGPFAACDGV